MLMCFDVLIVGPPYFNGLHKTLDGNTHIFGPHTYLDRTSYIGPHTCTVHTIYWTCWAG
ncbi:hypothetical protein HanIR_Chr12g0607051 [Helianthus annuus]|nr:hypothetical protein HanIR_Chr12g0607051 [Helianthus annuus]